MKVRREEGMTFLFVLSKDGRNVCSLTHSHISFSKLLTTGKKSVRERRKGNVEKERQEERESGKWSWVTGENCRVKGRKKKRMELSRKEGEGEEGGEGEEEGEGEGWHSCQASYFYRRVTQATITAQKQRKVTHSLPLWNMKEKIIVRNKEREILKELEEWERKKGKLRTRRESGRHDSELCWNDVADSLFPFSSFFRSIPKRETEFFPFTSPSLILLSLFLWKE